MCLGEGSYQITRAVFYSYNLPDPEPLAGRFMGLPTPCAISSAYRRDLRDG